MDMDQADTSSDTDTVKISLPWTWRPVKRRMLPGCEFFREGDTVMRIARKLIPLENDRDDDDSKDKDDSHVKDTLPCSVVGCMQIFTSLLSYENHYKSTHRHTCVTCHRTFPSAFLLDIHIQENHDSLFAILAERQNMYQCLVESCGDKFSAPDARRQHMIKVHSYPANFRFHRLRPSDPQHNRKQAAQSAPPGGTMDVDQPPRHTSAPKAQAKTDASGTPLASCTEASPAPPPSSNKENHRTGAGVCPGVEEEEEEEDKGEGEEGMEVLEAEKPPPVPRRVFVHKVPHNFSFGHGVSRGFQRPAGKKKCKKKGGHWHQRVGENSEVTATNIENVSMKDMADALSDAQ